MAAAAGRAPPPTGVPGEGAIAKRAQQVAGQRPLPPRRTSPAKGSPPRRQRRSHTRPTRERTLKYQLEPLLPKIQRITGITGITAPFQLLPQLLRSILA